MAGVTDCAVTCKGTKRKIDNSKNLTKLTTRYSGFYYLILSAMGLKQKGLTYTSADDIRPDQVVNSIGFVTDYRTFFTIDSTWSGLSTEFIAAVL
jgi:hypothetical protein